MGGDITRREFLWRSGALAAALAMPTAVPDDDAMHELVPRAFITALSVATYVDPLPIMQTARPVEYRTDATRHGLRIPLYRIEMREVLAKVHRDLPPTRMWTYGGTSPGPLFEARTGEPSMIEWVNALPKAHLFAVDHHIHGAEAIKPIVRAVVHLHGARVRPESDGYPEDWYVSGKSRVYHYPNEQDATMLWYHDHALGITRLNIYAGLVGAYIIRDAAEAALDLPSGKYEVPLVLYDRKIDSLGQLYYPASPMFDAPWLPEVYGDAILANGKLFPYLEVEPRNYRFRIVNVSNSRFMTLSLSNHQPMHQIGCDQGLLHETVPTREVILAPAERADVLIDFASERGARIVLSDASGPILQFRVSDSPPEKAKTLPKVLRTINPLSQAKAVKRRVLTLEQENNPAGKAMRMLLNGMHWSMPISERPRLGTIETWSFVNLTPDAHPIHLHLVRFQILDRREFDVELYGKSKRLKYTGAAKRPDPGEAGWKDTVRCPPAHVTRIVARFEGFKGRYVWHCHVLEHEDNEMMRPFEVIS